MCVQSDLLRSLSYLVEADEDEDEDEDDNVYDLMFIFVVIGT